MKGVSKRSLLKLIFQEASAPLVLVNTKGNISLLSQQAETLFDYQQDFVIGKPVNFLIPDIPSEAITPLKTSVEITSRTKSFILSGKKQDGTLFPIEFHVQYFFITKTTYLAGWIVDLTNPQLTVDDWAEKAPLLQMVWNAAADAIAVIDSEGMIQSVTSTYLSLYGCAAKQVFNKPFTSLSPPGIYKDNLKQYKEIFQSGQAPTTIESYIQRADKTYRHVEIKINFIDYGGTRCFMLANIRDVTERKTTEQTAAQVAHRLELLRQIGLELTAQLGLDTLLHSIVEKAITLVAGNAGGLYLYQPEYDILEWTIAVGPNITRPGSLLHKGEGISGIAWATNHTIVIDDYSKWVNHTPTYSEVERQAVLAMPIRWAGTLLGVLKVLAPQPFSTNDVAIMELFATQVATAIHNARLFEAEREQRLLAETFADITLHLAAHTDIESLLNEILIQAHRLVPYKTANVMLVKDAQLHVVQWRGYEAYGMKDYMTGLIQYLDDLPPDKKVVESGQPLLIQDTHEYPDWVILPQSSWIRSYLVMPIVRQGQVLGLLRLDDSKVGEFDEEDVKQLQPLANAAAIALDNAQLLSKTQEQNRELRLLNLISEIFQSNPSLDQVIQDIANAIHNATHFPIIIIELYDPDVQQMIVKGLVGFAGLKDLPNLKIPLTKALGGLVAQTSKTIIDSAIQKRPEYRRSLLRHLHIQTFIGIPLQANQRTLGVLCLASPTRWQKDNEFIQWLTGLADYISSLIDQKQIEEAMRHTQKLESLGVMAGGVAHDFNNLLTGLLMQNAIMHSKLGEDTLVHENLRQISQIIHRASDLTRQLLIYAGQAETQIELLDLNRLVEENENLLRTSVPRNVHIETVLLPNLPPIKADPGQIQQVVMNLIINAAEAYEGKSGTVWVSTRQEQWHQHHPAEYVGEKSLLPGAYVCMTVQDRGKGMEESTLQRIFEPFFTTKLTGRGLGLAAVLGIVRSHGGDIKVISQPGQGTTFQVWLPIVPGAAAMTLPNAPSILFTQTAHSKSGLVLVIDDEVVIRQAMSELLENLGLNILLAENGEVGLDLFYKHQNDISLILLDMTMPVMSGTEVLHLLYEAKTSVPIILSSGYRENSDLTVYKELNIAGFLHKPFHMDEFLSLIRQTLNFPSSKNNT